MSYSRTDYYAEGLSESFEEHGVTASSEQIRAIAEDVVLWTENIGMAFYSPPASDRLSDIEREWKGKLAVLQREFETYQEHAETAVKRALRQDRDARVTIGPYGEVTRHDGRSERIL